MKFKVWDKVRVTREGLAKQAESSFVKSYEISWWTIEKIAGDAIYCPNKEYCYDEKHLDLVPQEPEFKYWEEIEVRDQIGEKRKRVIFLCKTTANDTHQYITADISKKSFDNGALFCNTSWRFARKAPVQLTRKEVADKFWVSEDFVLVED